ncbi:histidine kinase [Amycolatopsis saalfeldensis]|uniref:histidine kinase n=1 Tax=Amycolatopsis saalfeldensis TaxID=394193 RepID=A0A1H8YIG2_9PSEU|nr:histidine kinase [Amycolatopsis saalfeldensis]SEP51228.1 Signal transduction histidine kinase [Amycolatopsis saalfeldensis]
MWGKAADAFRARLGDGLSRSGITLPWWAPLGISAFTGLPLVVAIAERDGRPPVAMTAAVLLAAGSAMLWVVTGRIAPSWAKSLAVLASVTVLLAYPVVPDFAPVMLAVLTAEVSAIAAGWLAFVVAAAGIGVLGAASATVGLVGFPVYTLAVLLGLCAGFTLRWYVRALDAERGKQEAVRDQAMLAERQRIAREVHDVVAHSLSITLLHLTGARHGLRTDRDIDEAVAALTEAERVGRAAMADIRRTVGLLAREPAGTKPLPDAGDIAELVAGTRAAGLDTRYTEEGDVGAVGAAAGLGLYRIAQESLANVVKHAPAATVAMRLRIEPEQARLTVRNRRSSDTRPAGDGSGLAGMSARADQLGARLLAGPEGGDWVVDVTVPLVPGAES